MAAQLYALGIDPSPKRLGYAIARVHETGWRPIECGTYHMEPGPHALVQAMKKVRHRMTELNGDPTVIGIESGFVGANAATAIQIIETMGGAAALAAAAWPRPEIRRLTPSGWRSLAGLSPRATKAEVYERATRLGWPLKDGDQDAADAALICHACRPR